MKKLKSNEPEKIYWDGLIDEIKILPCSSGGWKIEISTRIIGNHRMMRTIAQLINLRDVPNCVYKFREQDNDKEFI